MKTLHVSQDIVPVGAFKAQASRLLRRLKDEHRPIVITQNGKPAAVLVTPEEFDRLCEHSRFLDAVHAGLADSAAGLLTDDEDLDSDLDRALGKLAT
ncbi:MAG: type II toxin-antitoxin system Phd/YefM family antitoxin [Thermodesulfobacteriota bacterium]